VKAGARIRGELEIKGKRIGGGPSGHFSATYSVINEYGQEIDTITVSGVMGYVNGVPAGQVVRSIAQDRYPKAKIVVR